MEQILQYGTVLVDMSMEINILKVTQQLASNASATEIKTTADKETGRKYLYWHAGNQTDNLTEPKVVKGSAVKA